MLRRLICLVGRDWWRTMRMASTRMTLAPRLRIRLHLVLVDSKVEVDGYLLTMSRQRAAAVAVTGTPSLWYWHEDEVLGRQALAVARLQARRRPNAERKPSSSRRSRLLCYHPFTSLAIDSSTTSSHSWDRDDCYCSIRLVFLDPP